MPNGGGGQRDRIDGDLSNPRWQGVTDARLNGLEDWVRDLDRKQDEAREDQAQKREKDQRDMAALRVDVARLKTQVGVWSAVGGILGAGAVSALIQLIGVH